MSISEDIVRFVVRQAEEAVDDEPKPGHCTSENEYDGRMGLRVSAIFVILVGSTLGAVFPVFARRNKHIGIPDWAFFIAKYFGSGVIIATAFIHLLAPANENLKNPCLTGPVTVYPWPEAIALMTIFFMFFLELMTMRYGNLGGGHEHDAHAHDTVAPPNMALAHTLGNDHSKDSSNGDSQSQHHARGDDHLGHARDHQDNSDVESDWAERGHIPETYAAQMTAIFILEFGVIFHSIFIGLTLAVAGAEFITLYVVLVFHQTFEGLGLGARLATVPWPKSKRWTPYMLGLGYGLSTPIAIAIGLGVRDSYPPGSATTLMVNGVFDSISAGILIYTGLVELMAHEFMFSPYMQKGPVSRLLSAFGLMCLGAALMSLLGYWA